MTVATHADCRVFVNNPARTAKFPVFGWTDLSVSVDKFGMGGGEITFPSSRPWYSWASVVSTAGLEFAENSIDIFYRNRTTPLVVGMPVKVKRSQKGSARLVTVEFETIVSHVLRRRLMLTSTNGKNAASLSEDPDDMAKRLMRQAFGDLVVTPAGYPASRTDWGSLTINVDTTYNGLHPTGITFYEIQAGQNMRELLLRLCEEYDLYIYADETSAGTFEFDVDYPYQQNDYSASVFLSPLHGSLSGYEQSTDYTSLANVWMVGGDGEGAAQNIGFTQDSTSVSDLGVFEDRMTAPSAAASQVTVDGEYLKNLRGQSTVTYGVEVRETANELFNQSYTLRDKVSVYSDAYSNTVQQVIVGYSLDIGPDGAKVKLDIQDPPRSMLGEVFTKVGGVGGGLSSGGYWKEKAG